MKQMWAMKLRTNRAIDTFFRSFVKLGAKIITVAFDEGYSWCFSSSCLSQAI